MASWRRVVVTALILLTCTVLGMTFFVLSQKVVDLSILERYNPGKPTLVLDDQGKEWTRFQLDRRDPVSIVHLPHHIIDAFLAAEDHDFFNHAGISWRGIVRSTLINLYNGKIVQGASTITQQLVKLLFFDAQKTFERKFKEQCYAVLVEHQFTKEQILETYLNHVYFGSGIYGVEAAAQRFWGIPAQELSLEQAATLAATVQSPSRYCPVQYPLSAQRRRNVVLSCMNKLGCITREQYEQTVQAPLTLRPQDREELAPHLKESLRLFLEGLVGKEKLYAGGLKVQTTINQDMQRKIQRLFAQQVRTMRKTIDANIDGALISMEVKTGEIKALIGGADFASSKFNRAFQARRQMGSIFKPIIYAAAVEAGHSLADTDVDEPFEMIDNNRVWMPQNFSGDFEGRMTLARALSHSNNIVTIKTLLNIGCERVKALGEKFHLPDLQPYPSLALGCIDITLKQGLASFNVFANNGMYVEPHYVLWVKDELGNKLYRYNVVQEQLMQPWVSGQVAKVLGLGMERMRQRLADRWIDSESIGKTGTTNECRTCWFVGATPALATAVYIGCDDNRSMGKQVFARKTAFPIWFGLHKEVGCHNKHFVYDQSLQELLIDLRSGYPVDDQTNPEHGVILVSGQAT